MSNWRDDLGVVTHPPAFAAFAIDIGPITITIDGAPRKLIGASFRGVSFFVEQSHLEGGRRLVNHNFPLRDKNFVDDLGKKERHYKFEGYVIGNSYLDQKNDLIDACEDADSDGPGTLKHPYYGSKLVTCSTFGVRETRDEGGWAAFSLDFLETPQDPPFPTITISLGSLLGALLGAIAGVIGAIAALALAVLMTALLVAACIRAVQAIVDAITDLASLFDGQDGAEFLLAMGDIELDLDFLVRNPGQLLERIDAAFDATSSGDPAAMMGGLLNVYAADPGPPPTRGGKYFAALTTAFRRYALLKAAQYAGAAKFDSYQAAVAARDRLAQLLDLEADDEDENVYYQMTQVRSVIAQLIPPRGVDAQVVAYAPPATVPSLVLAYQLYGSVQLEQDVIDRNREAIPHPGFVLGGVELEVLSRG